MGFRFQKRITIAPGIRLNISKSGVSTSFGPRGLSVTAGRRGTYLNMGVPGTGLSYREKLDNQLTGILVRGGGGYSGVVNIDVDSGGVLRFTDGSGNDLPASAAKRVKAERATEIGELLIRAAEKINSDLEACVDIHLSTPSPTSSPLGLPAFDKAPPRSPIRESISLMDKLLLRSDKIEQAHAAAVAKYQIDVSAWRAERETHNTKKAEVEKVFRLASKGFSAQMENALDFVLSRMKWPKETQVTYVFSHDNTGIAVDVDLPDEDETPRTSAEVRATGKLAIKRRSDAQCRKDFIALAFGSLFRVAGEVFTVLPGIQKVLVSGYIQRTDLATGNEYNEYLISVVIGREKWSQIDFECLEKVDPAATFRGYNAGFKLDRSSRLKGIEPYNISDLG